MRIRCLKLHPFAGFSSAEFAFASGLNVVIGANDKGKSSLFRAIDSSFFLPAKASRSTREGRDLLPRVLPLGSDHARVDLEFEVRGEAYRLAKSWGQNAGISLEGPGSLRLLSEEKVDEALRSLLPAPPATFQGVLFMGQGALEGTVKALEEKREALHSLGDLLRVTVDKTAGVSVERLKEALQKEIVRAFQHWELATNLPEKGKGIEDPWLKNVGMVLASYYERERTRRDSLLAKALESERDRKLAELNSKQAGREEARAFVRANEKLVASVATRQALEAKCAKAKAESDGKSADLSAWLQANSRREIFAPEVERLQAQRKRLEEELSRSLGQAKARDLIGRFERIKAARASFEECRKRLESLPIFRAEELKKIRASVQELEGLKAGLKAGKLQVQFTVKKDLEVLVRKDLDPVRKGVMPAGKPMTLNAGGRVQLSCELFDLQVISGEGRVAEIEEQLNRKSDALGKLLAEKSVSTLEEAQERFDLYAEALSAAKAAESALQALLGGENFEAVERLAQVGLSMEMARPADSVRPEMEALGKELEQKRDQLVGSQSLVQELVRRHGAESVEALTAQMLASRAELADFERQIGLLPPLPVEAASLVDFTARFEAAKVDAERLADLTRDLSVQIEAIKLRLQNELGGQSAQDFERGAAEAEANFANELARGRALLRVEAAIASVEGKGSDLYAGFQASFARQAAELSGGKYANVKMKDSLPAEFQRADGALIPYGWLSAGTKDAFALALRLAMADHFLGQRDGFLLVDDPLVNMDPERQKIAAAMLREFSSRRQVVVFTCHPAHAELLGGNQIAL